jgi:hypothetical protein
MSEKTLIIVLEVLAQGFLAVFVLTNAIDLHSWYVISQLPYFVCFNFSDPLVFIHI